MVTGVRQVAVASAMEALSLLRRATDARATSSTAMNSESSRSHSVFMLNITGNHAASGTRLTGAPAEPQHSRKPAASGPQE